jgi:hypothetical protein
MSERRAVVFPSPQDVVFRVAYHSDGQYYAMFSDHNTGESPMVLASSPVGALTKLVTILQDAQPVRPGMVEPKSA